MNGTLVSVDNTPYTPFNSSIVRFRVKRPYTLAFLVVDWDAHLGQGMEVFPNTPAGKDWYPGDAGLIARFSDGTVTDSNWKAQSFYIARERPRHDRTRARSPGRQEAGLPGEVLRGALPDPLRLAVLDIQRLDLAARVRVHGHRYRYNGLAGLLSLS